MIKFSLNLKSKPEEIDQSSLEIELEHTKQDVFNAAVAQVTKDMQIEAIYNSVRKFIDPERYEQTEMAKKMFDGQRLLTRKEKKQIEKSYPKVCFEREWYTSEEYKISDIELSLKDVIDRLFEEQVNKQ